MQVRDLFVHRLTHQHLTGLGRALQPRRHVHDLADRGEILAELSDLPDRDVSGVDSDPDTESIGLAPRRRG